MLTGNKPSYSQGKVGNVEEVYVMAKKGASYLNNQPYMLYLILQHPILVFLHLWFLDQNCTLIKYLQTCPLAFLCEKMSYVHICTKMAFYSSEARHSWLTLFNLTFLTLTLPQAWTSYQCIKPRLIVKLDDFLEVLSWR